jgi:hypothetical protein
MKSSSHKPYYTITDAAKELGITRAAVHRAIKQGRLDAERGDIIKLVRTKTKGWKISQPSLNSYRVTRGVRSLILRFLSRNFFRRGQRGKVLHSQISGLRPFNVKWVGDRRGKFHVSRILKTSNNADLVWFFLSFPSL